MKVLNLILMVAVLLVAVQAVIPVLGAEQEAQFVGIAEKDGFYFLGDPVAPTMVDAWYVKVNEFLTGESLTGTFPVVYEIHSSGSGYVNEGIEPGDPVKVFAAGPFQRGDSYYFDVARNSNYYIRKEEQDPEVKFRGEIVKKRGIISFYSIDTKITAILEKQPGVKLKSGHEITVYGHRDGPATVEPCEVGDSVEVFGKYKGTKTRGGITSEYVDLETSGHYLIVDTAKDNVSIATFHAGTWWVDANSNGVWDGPNTDIKVKGFGSPNNQSAICDFDDDGTDEIATFNRGIWWIDKNNNYKWDGPQVDKRIPGFGTAGNKVACADFDDDGTDEIATFNRGTWWIDKNDNDQWDGPNTDKKVQGYGNANNQVAAADFDGNGTDEIATFSAGTWWIDLNNNDKWDGTGTDEKVQGYGTADNIVAAGNDLPASATSSTQLGPQSGPAIASTTAYPNPVSTKDTVTFKVEGKDIASTKLEVFAASGKQVYTTDYTQGTTTTWKLTTNEGQPVPNGVYLYQVKAKGTEGQTTTSQFEKLIVLR